MPDSTTQGSPTGQGAAPAATASSGGSAPAAAPAVAPAQAGGSTPSEAAREARVRASAERFLAARGVNSGSGTRNAAEGAGDSSTGQAPGNQKPERPGQSPEGKPHPNSREAKLADQLLDARRLLSRAGKDKDTLDRMPDAAILMMAEMQRDHDRRMGEQGSRGKNPDPKPQRPAGRDSDAKGTGEGPDDLLPPETDDDPLAEPSPQPKTQPQQQLQDGLRKFLDQAKDADPELEKSARGVIRQVRDHFHAETVKVKAQVADLQNHLRNTLDLVAQARRELAFGKLAQEFPQLAEPQAQAAFFDEYQKRWDPDLLGLLGDPKQLMDDLSMLAAHKFGRKATHDAKPAEDGQPPNPGNTGRQQAQKLSRDDFLRESAALFTNKDLTPEQRNIELAKLKQRRG